MPHSRLFADDIRARRENAAGLVAHPERERVARRRRKPPALPSPPHALSLINDTGEMLTLADLEAQAIRFALLHYQGHMLAISRHLGIGRSTLYRKLKELGLDDEAARRLAR